MKRGNKREDEHEALVGSWLIDQGFKVRHQKDGEDPPDFVINGEIAVEVTTVVSYDTESPHASLKNICNSLGVAENGHGYVLSVMLDWKTLQDNNKQKYAVIKHYRKEIKNILRAYYYTDTSIPTYKSVSLEGYSPFWKNPEYIIPAIRLPNGVLLVLTKADNPKMKFFPPYFGIDCVVWPGSHVITVVQKAIQKKTDKHTIKEQVKNHKEWEWWLALTAEPAYTLGFTESNTNDIAKRIAYAEPWKRILLIESLDAKKVNRVFDLSKNTSKRILE